jgi:hypothetical protein
MKIINRRYVYPRELAGTSRYDKHLGKTRRFFLDFFSDGFDHSNSDLLQLNSKKNIYFFGVFIFSVVSAVHVTIGCFDGFDYHF